MIVLHILAEIFNDAAHPAFVSKAESTHWHIILWIFLRLLLLFFLFIFYKIAKMEFFVCMTGIVNEYVFKDY